jgi:hypothetical protein
MSEILIFVSALFDEIDADKDGYLVVAEARDFIIRSILTPEEKESLKPIRRTFSKARFQS